MTTNRLTRVIGAVVAQLLLVGVAVWVPLSTRLTGDEISLRVQVVDPGETFSGAYVDVAYPDLPEQPLAVEGPVSREDPDRGVAYVPLTQQGSVWVGGDVQRTAPGSGLYLLCDDSDWRLQCGIERAYLPTGSRDGVEGALRSGTAVATVRVDSSGHAALIGVATP